MRILNIKINWLFLMALLMFFHPFNVYADLISLNVPTTATSTYQTSYSSNAVDGNYSAEWNAGSGEPESITLELEGYHYIDGIRMLTSQMVSKGTYESIHEIYLNNRLIHTFDVYATNNQWIEATFGTPYLGSDIKVTTTMKDDWVAWREIEVFGAKGPDNIALNENVTATASDYYWEGSSPYEAIDGDFATSWNAGAGGNQWIQFNLGAFYDIDQINLWYDSSSKNNRTVNDTVYIEGEEVASWTMTGILNNYCKTILFGDDVIGSKVFVDAIKDGWVAFKEIEIFGTFVEPLPEPIPEPATMLLLGTGLFGLAGFRKRSKRF